MVGGGDGATIGTGACRNCAKALLRPTRVVAATGMLRHDHPSIY